MGKAADVAARMFAAAGCRPTHFEGLAWFQSAV
jgi:hypothetical protein